MPFGMKSLLRNLPVACLAAGLMACVPSPTPAPWQKPADPQRPGPAAPHPEPSTKPQAPPETVKSAAARVYFADVQRILSSQGLLRTDGGGPDTPWTDWQLVENFQRIALHDEYMRSNGMFVRVESPSVLRRWKDDVRVSVIFGPSVSPERQAKDLGLVKDYLARLSRATGHSIELADDDRGNFSVYIVSEDEREALGPALRAAMPGLTAIDIQDVTMMPRSTYCMVYALSDGSSGRYRRAVAVVRAEHPDLMRQSCLHEEIAQGLGLANDSPRARPSIFNDDEEFALLTRMDEMLLRLLYHPELQPGMTAATARPIVQRLAKEMMPENRQETLPVAWAN